MAIVNKLKTLFGIGPLLLVVFFLIEGIAIYFSQLVKLTMGLPLQIQTGLTLIVVILLLSGLAWFNRTIQLIHISFLGKEKKLIIKGPFQYVRHPLYSTLLFTLPVLFLIWFNNFIFLLPWLIIILVAHIIVKVEEKKLIQEFGEAYKKYQSCVPPLIPYRKASKQ